MYPKVWKEVPRGTRDSKGSRGLFGAPIRGTGNQGAKTTRNQAIRHAAGHCWIFPEIAGYCGILLDIARHSCGAAGTGHCQILPDIVKILPDFAGFCQNFAGYCRILSEKRLAKFGNVGQYLATMGLPDIARYYQLTAGYC